MTNLNVMPTKAVEPAENDTAWWEAVLAKDGGQDGRFVYAVLSTGIYCRPCCSARRPRRDNVVFFRRPEEAERAGFRACLRCRPSANGSRDSRAALVQQVCEFVEGHLEERLTLATLSKKFALSSFHLHRSFKAALGITPRQYIDACRMKSLKSRLQAGHSVTEAVYEAGYGSSSRLYERSDAQLGMTPATYRRRGQGVFIRYTFVDSPIGRMLVAASDKGVCSIGFGDSEVRLLQGLKREYPDATLRRGEVVLRRWIAALLDRFHGETSRGNLPLDIQATAFRRRVWEHLQSIPYGGTRSYGQVAKALGEPNAARAVARACANNPVAVAVPCHRVVREDGHLGGYRWGLERKRALLALEQRKAAQQTRPVDSKSAGRI